MEKNWLVNLIELAKNEETAEVKSRKSKHQIDGVEEVTSTKRVNLTNVSLDDSRSNTTNVAYSGKKLDDRSILESADSKMNQVNNNLHSVPSSNVNREEDIDPEYYDVKKRAKILYSWEDSINKIDFKDTSKKDVSTQCDEILFGEVKPKDSLSISAKKDLVKLANFQTDALNDLIKKYGNKIGMISFGIW
ncbi:51_t:CDS:2, partial [Racocetra fulgida]